MDLGTIEMLVERDPAQAKKLIAQARRNSAEALDELRDLVRGIHPPVLAERGLGDAVRALALRLPLATEVTVELSGRADAPVESAGYFAVNELLTNAVKHSDADRVWVDVHHTDGRLRITVTDNGRGGAAIGAGSGLTGVERRLGTFDGVLAVSSPAGGPTMVTMEIPCVLS
jgi:signal transduction histidine kinase